jgi:protein required for attachment to host cells
MAKQITWIVVADGSQAKVFALGKGGTVELLHETARPHPPSRDLVSDRPGRTFDSAGAGRHAKEPTSDAHDRAEADFIGTVADHLKAAHENREFDQLVVIAAPQALGDWRTVCSGPLKQSVTREIPKDATNIPVPEIPKFLAQNDVI